MLRRSMASVRLASAGEVFLPRTDRLDGGAINPGRVRMLAAGFGGAAAGASIGLLLLAWRTSGRGARDEARGLQPGEDSHAAEMANAAKSRYLASVSHEIRAPLHSIYGYAQLLERGGAIDVAEAARIIQRSAEHLTSMVDGLTDISQVESGILRVSTDVVRLAPFLDQIADMFKHGAAAKGLRFVYERPETLPELVRMDQNRLRQVLINLLTNAIKFTNAGSVGFHVIYAGQMAIFEVRDTGLGIAPADRERIFAPFERGSVAEAHEQPGTGLGLAITQALVRILGGDLQMESVPDEGTVFRVKMMVGQTTARPSEVAAAALTGGYEGARRAILVVDDDPQQLALMQTLLAGLGFDVVLASSGRAALAASAEQRFDLVLLDIAMPGLSGWETAARLRAMEGAGARIVMVSGNAHERHQPGVDAPIRDQFMVKPVELSALVTVIGSQLGLRWTTPGAETADRPTTGDGKAQEPLPEAARRHLAKIRELMSIGHVRGLEREIKALATAAPEADHLVARLFDALDRYDFTAMETALEAHR